ncbi:GATOR complex protein DEPDC5 [Taenia crassiceps]|uniref:GATOR complex protein DEPDC5 n=1 Tax=Taenia crassiceps TaxID=6207 RepID=A0ABR4QL94_9CEST
MARSEVKLKLLCHPRIDTKLRVSGNTIKVVSGLDDVLLDSRDNHGIMPGDIIELRHPDHPTPTLFLVKSLREDCQHKAVKIPEKSAFSRNTDGQVYLDFYKVIVHNERYSNEEWKRNFSQLMLAFKSYEQEIKNYVLRNLPGVNDPKRISIRLSTAREANILEGLNLALSGYECYNVDRSFDRTGNACIMISPGFGVFDADREMVAFTKQRVLDLGTVVHLVCLGPQPLHAVPLFVCRDFENPNNSEVYIVPHWMNYSFFRSSREIYALNNSETVTRINVKARKAKIPGFCNCSIRWKNSRILSSKKSNSGTGSSDFDSDSYYQWKNLEKDGEREQNHNTLQINFESAKSLRERQHQRRKAITSMLSTTMPDNTHQRTVSLNEELLSASIAMVDTRSVEVGLSTPELGSFGSISSTHGWNIGAHLCSRAQSCVCSEMHSPLGGNLLLTDGFPPDALEEPSWLKLYGYSALDGGCTSAHKKALGVTNVVYGRKYSNIMDTLVHRKPQDFTHSYQSGSSYQPRGVTRLCKNTAAPVDFLACATASSWQPTGEGEVGRCQPRSILVKNGSKKPVRLTSAVAVEGFFRTFPFGIHPQLFGVHKTISQRRWGHFHTAAHRLHPIKYDQTLCMRLLEGLRPRINLAKIWHAYFSFHRYIVAALLDEAGVNARNQQQQGIENILNAFSGLPLHKSTEYHMPTTSPIADGIPSQLPLASREIDNEGSFPYGRVTIPFSDLMLKFTFSAAWRALCAAVDSPDVIQVCSQGNVDIISPGEMKSLEKALASTSEFCVGCMSGATLSPLPHHRRLLLEMLKPVGIDWKSLTTPALLPLTTDYFPETSSLLGEGYMIHEYRIVLITISDKEWNLHFDIKAFPGLAYSRHPLSGQQVLEELVSQRVAQGFQLCIEEEAAATNGTGATPLKTSDTCQSVAPSTLPSEGVSGSLTPVLPTPKRAIHSHSLAFRLRHQTAHKAGATKAKTLPAGLQERPSPSVTSQSRMAFTGGLSAASKTVHSCGSLRCGVWSSAFVYVASPTHTPAA